jgi:mono/diheme cytochrome c family protein
MKILTTASMLVIATASAGPAADATAGKAVYDRACKSCHGADGTGNPAIAKAMKVELKDIRQTPDADVKKAVASGFGKMHAVASVNAAQTDDVIAYLHSLK